MNKVFGIKFYKSGLKVILSYLFFSIVTVAINKYYFHTGLSWGQGLMGILSFSSIPYAWYIEMWIGLFLLAPFLNVFYKSLDSKRMKQWLIVVLFCLTAPPDFFNRYGLHIYPAFWENVYPLTFYFIGCYIREYRPQIKRLYLGIGIVGIVSVAPLFNSVISYPTYIHIIGDRNGLFCTVLAVMLFLCFYNVTLRKQWTCNIFKIISLRSLDIFLCSSMFDAAIYPLFKDHFFVNQSQFGIYFFAIIPVIFCCSFIVASLKRLLFRFLQKCITMTYPHLELKIT